MQKEEIYKKFEELDKVAALGGGVVRIDKQHEAGRMTARERIDMLLDKGTFVELDKFVTHRCCLLYTSPSPRDSSSSRMPSSA